jgi:hypothetical protein
MVMIEDHRTGAPSTASVNCHFKSWTKYFMPKLEAQLEPLSVEDLADEVAS